MMTSLFSVFDPMSWGGLSLNWMSGALGLGLIPVSYWAAMDRGQALWTLVSSTLLKEFKLLLGARSGSIWLLLGLFFFIFFNNSLGLAPYIFTSSAHMSLSLSLALPMWLSFMLYGWILHTTHMFAHLVPQGTPGPLMMFMVLIETVSNVIRPVTLAIRLSANMVAGHLLLTLMGNAGAISVLGGVVVLSQTALVILELAVAAVQAYVFAVLTALYASEV